VIAFARREERRRSKAVVLPSRNDRHEHTSFSFNQDGGAVMVQWDGSVGVKSAVKYVEDGSGMMIMRQQLLSYLRVTKCGYLASVIHSPCCDVIGRK
jgi:hypothetical protein